MKNKVKTLRILPLGGLGEIGRNMYAYQYGGKDVLVVDAGLMFPEQNKPGIDYLIPDFEVLLDGKHTVHGIVLTHGHEDHIGAIHHVIERLNVPVYGAPLTLELVRNKLQRAGLLDKTDLRLLDAGDVVQIGPFQVEGFHVCHSIPDSIGLGIQTPAGLVVHSGDYKLDMTPADNRPTDLAKLAEFCSRGVLAFLGESTNAVEPGWTPTEQVVVPAFDQIFREAHGRIFIATFASLVSRVQQAANAARKYNRKLAFMGTSMVDNVKIARRLGLLQIDESMIISIEQATSLPDKQVAVLCTGSQGEPNSVLERLSNGRSNQVSIRPGDTVVLSSHPIPGNEESVYSTINRLFKLDAHVNYDKVAPVHVSGHANQEEMKMMINLLKPRYIIPIHGELRHLKQHEALARSMGIPVKNIAVLENGQTLTFQNGHMKLGETVALSSVFVDGSSVGDVDAEVINQRASLARDGMIITHLVLDKNTGVLVKEPEFISRGFMMDDDAQELLAQMRVEIEQTVSRANGNLQMDVVKAMRKYLRAEAGRTPTVFVTVSQV